MQRAAERRGTSRAIVSSLNSSTKWNYRNTFDMGFQVFCKDIVCRETRQMSIVQSSNIFTDTSRVVRSAMEVPRTKTARSDNVSVLMRNR